MLRPGIIVALALVIAAGSVVAEPVSITLPPVDAKPVIHASDKPDEIVHKVIEVYGGREKLKQWRCGRVRLTWKSNIRDEPVAGTFQAEEYFDYPGRFKRIWTTQKDGKDAVTTLVIDRGAGWSQSADKGVEPLPKDLMPLADKQKHDLAHCNDVCLFEDKSLTLTNMGEKMVGNRPAILLLVATASGAEKEVYFDRASGLILKTRMANARPGQIDGDIVESTYSDYKRFQGMVFPTRITATSEGKPVTDMHILELKFEDKLPDSIFAKPK